MIDRPSPNYGPRRDGLCPTFVILHYTAMTSLNAAADRLCDPNAEVSAHYLIGRDGTVLRLVAEEHRAWHAGAGEWCGQTDMNSCSIGIEMDNDGRSPFAASLMDALTPLLASITERYSIPLQNVIGHADMAPLRKTDPGRRFDWARLHRAGLVANPAFAPAPALFKAPADAAECADLLTQIGYARNAPLPAKLQAFRDRFLPVSRGSPNAADREMMLHYLADYGSSSLCKKTPAGGSRDLKT